MKKLTIEEKERRAQLVLDNYGGIVPCCEAFYLHAILYSAGRSLQSFKNYMSLRNENVNPEYLISIVQEALCHAAALSRYFWPSLPGMEKEPFQRILKENRGRKLCHICNLDETSPLYGGDLQDLGEQFDEKLDAYVLDNYAGNFFPICILGSHTLADNRPLGHIFKLLDIESECIVLLDKKYFFMPIYREVLRVFNLANETNSHVARSTC